jgi:hypothetical protein
MGGETLQELEVGWFVSMQRDEVVRPIFGDILGTDRIEVHEGRGASEKSVRTSKTWPEQCVAGIVEKSRLLVR